MSNPEHRMPTLLIWGDNDAISPPSVGERLTALIKESTLRIIADGDHDLGKERAGEIAPLVIDHVTKIRQRDPRV